MRSFLGIQAFPLQVSPIGQPLQLGTPSKFPPVVVPIAIDWNVPWQFAGNPPAVGVVFNLLTSANRPPIDLIKSVYVDNTNSASPVYVHFPSTGMTISVAPQTAAWYPAITQDLQVQVFAEGLTAGFIPKTSIFFTNQLVSPYADPEINQAVALWLASPSITRGTTILNTNFGVPALGDQAAAYVGITSTNVVMADNLWGTPIALPINFVYLTHISMYAASTVNTLATWVLESPGISALLYEFNLIGGLNAPGAQRVLSLDGMNLKLDASQDWRLRMAAVSGTVTWTLNTVFTTNPN